jgi:hypothetical protein
MSRYRAFCERRIAAGLCVRCAGKMPPDRKAWRCVDCVTANRSAGRKCYRMAKARGLCPCCRKPWTSDGYATCPKCRHTAKARFALRDASTERKRRGPYASKALLAIDAQLRSPCKRCGLRGNHECLSPAAYAGVRRGA